MNASLSTSGNQAVVTYGWDTVFVLPASTVNQAIVSTQASPKGFTYSGTASFFGSGTMLYEVSASFKDWQITTGGDGKNIRLLLPMQNGTLVVKNQTTSHQLSFATGLATIEVELQYLAHTDSNGATSHKLMVKTVADSADNPVVYLLNSTYEGDPPLVPKCLIDSALSTWCNENLSQFTHVFAMIGLNSTIDQDQWGFIAPNYTSYAYLDIGDNLNDSLLAILCMTGDRTGEGLSQQVASNAIPTGSVAGFLVSQRRTLSDLIRPVICMAYPGVTTGNFTVSSDGTSISLQDGITIDLPSASSNGKDYYPVLKQLSVKANGQILQLDSYTETLIDPFYGITATCTATHWYNLGLGTSSNGQTLVFQQAQSPSITHSFVQSTSGANTQEIIQIVETIALLILGVLTEGAAFVASGVILGLALGINQVTPSLIGNYNQNTAPSLDLLLVNSVDPIQWTGGNKFTLDYAGLNVSLQLGGNPNFS